MICALVAVLSLPVLAWAGDAEPTPGPASSQTLPLPGMLPAMTPTMAPTMSPNSWAGFYVNESGDLALSSGAPSLLNGLLGPGGIGAGQAIGGMSSGAVGANWQTGDTVIGVQGDMQWADPAAAAITDCGLGCSLNDYARVPWLATLRARAGKTFDGLLVYGTGGFASFGAANNLNAGGFGSTPNFMNLPAGTIDWSIGGGMELSLDKNVSAKIEYLHNTPTGVSGSLFDNDSKNNIVRGGIDYRLPVGTW
jgi:outer membrane immunogenic protein